jgi:hypothetical protein
MIVNQIIINIGTIHVQSYPGNLVIMQNPLTMSEKIRNEDDLLTARENLKNIYREIIRLVIKKEEFEERIEEYLKSRQD